MIEVKNRIGAVGIGRPTAPAARAAAAATAYRADAMKFPEWNSCCRPS
jgi:hypothetical protein